MLRIAIRNVLYRQYGAPTSSPRFVCAFCNIIPRRLSSTAPVLSFQDGSASEGGLAPSPQHGSLSEREPAPAQGETMEAFFSKKKSKKDAKVKKDVKPGPKARLGGPKLKKVVSKNKLKTTKEKEPESNPRRKKRAPMSAKREEENPESKCKRGKRKREDPMIPRGTQVLEEGSGLSVDDLDVRPVPITNQGAVATLSHGLDRVLFNPGVVYLQDPRSRVFNFDPYLQNIMPVTEFDFDAIASYITSSQDTTLESLMKGLGKKYMGSTSSMTSVLSHFHYLLSSWRPINLDILSQAFENEYRSFTAMSRLPTSIFLRYKGDGTYAIDSDKELDGENILSFMGRSMEKLLTLPPDVFEKYRRENSHMLGEDVRNAPETYHYSTFGDFLMRSQLDAHDPRLPGTGMFDLKTRAVVAVRIDVSNFQLGSGYQIKTRTGNWESFEREYFDMIRAAFLKYSLQVRMGRMDGIFVAYHNTEKIFGFQYISLDEMDAALHGGPGTGIGTQEFKMSLSLLNKTLNKAIERFPERSLRIHFETRETTTPYMYIFAEPMEEDQIEEIQKGERGTVEEFMAKIKEKIQAAKEAKEKKLLGIEGEDEESETKVTDDAETEEDVATMEIEAAMESDEEVDEDFLKELQAQKERDSGSDLIGLTLLAKNFINGKEVQRPEFLAEDDKWEVGYTIAEFTSNERAWSTYNALRVRKKKVFRARLSSADPEQIGGYHRAIRELSKRGRTWEEYQEKLDADREKIVFPALSK